MPIFPLKMKDKGYVTIVPRRFGSPRPWNAAKPTRKHPGCDLTASAGDEVFAVADGRVIESTNTGFLVKTDSAGNEINIGVVAISHGEFYDILENNIAFVARYGEIDSVTVSIGEFVKQGQVIAKVARQGIEGTQLHFEMYSGKANGPLTQTNNPPYKRRADLIDPTPFLDSWEVEK